jgi:hypothetical protein
MLNLPLRYSMYSLLYISLLMLEPDSEVKVYSLTICPVLYTNAFRNVLYSL